MALVKLVFGALSVLSPVVVLSVVQLAHKATLRTYVACFAPYWRVVRRDQVQNPKRSYFAHYSRETIWKFLLCTLIPNPPPRHNRTKTSSQKLLIAAFESSHRDLLFSHRPKSLDILGLSHAETGQAWPGQAWPGQAWPDLA